MKMSADCQPREQNDDMKTSDDEQDTHLPSTTGDTITLQVGEHRFTTFASTLTAESPYFTSLLSARWQHVQDDGSYFVDADGALFPYILRYLRSSALPVFYSGFAGHDYGMYQALLGEAQYFQIVRLTDWLKNKEYEKAVKVEYSAEEFEGCRELTQSYCSNLQMEYHPTWMTKKVYICPRGIWIHRGNPSACGRSCMKAQGDTGNQFEDEDVLKTVVISKRTVFNSGLCLQE